MIRQKKKKMRGGKIYEKGNNCMRIGSWIYPKNDNLGTSGTNVGTHYKKWSQGDYPRRLFYEEEDVHRIICWNDVSNIDGSLK